MIKTALYYASKGLQVLPVRERGKEPLCAHGVHDATTDEATIRAQWATTPSANIAIAVPPQWVVLDVDLREDGDAKLEGLELEHGELPSTVIQRTGSGGMHILFVRPNGLELRGRICKGLDVLGAGRYFIAAPSVHPCGGRYQWASPKGTPIALPPEWLVRLIRKPEAPPGPRYISDVSETRRLERASKWLAHRDPAIEDAGGDNHTFVTCAIVARGFDLSEAAAMSILTDWNRRCRPPWRLEGSESLRRKLRQAIQFSTVPIGSMLTAPKRAA